MGKECNKKVVKICTQANIPTIDDSLIECAECGFTSTNCIISKDMIVELGLPANSNLTDIIKKLVLSLEDAKNRILILESV